MRVGAVIVTYNFDDIFCSVLEKISRQFDKILIFDNSNSLKVKDTLDTIISNYSNVNVYYSPKNVGIARAYNYGFPIMFKNGMDYCVSFDQDSLIHDDFLKCLISFAKSKSNGIYCGNYTRANIDKPMTYDFFTRVRRIKRGTFCGGNLVASFGISSGCMISKEIYEKVGTFVDELFIDYIDIEYCLRAGKLGITTFIVQDARFLQYLGNPISKSLFGFKIFSTDYTPFRLFHISRNRVFCWRIYGLKLFGFFMHDLRQMILDLIRIVVVEEDRSLKIRQIFKGLLFGIFSRNPIKSTLNKLTIEN